MVDMFIRKRPNGAASDAISPIRSGLRKTGPASHGRELRCYDYATIPYEEVRAILRADAHGLIQRATLSALERAKLVGATLRTEVGPFEVGAEVKIRIGRVTEEISAQGERIMRVELSWTAAESAPLFPSMDAVLVAHPLSSGETHLELDGRYYPPLGPVGGAFDVLVGHRIAEACVQRFLRDIARQLDDEHAGRASCQTHA